MPATRQLIVQETISLSNLHQCLQPCRVRGCRAAANRAAPRRSRIPFHHCLWTSIHHGRTWQVPDFFESCWGSESTSYKLCRDEIAEM